MSARGKAPNRPAPLTEAEAAKSQDSSSTAFARVGKACARHPRLVLTGWALALLAALVTLPGFLGGLTGFQVGVSGSESQRASALVQRHFANAFAEQDLIVFQSDRETVRDPAFRQVITQAIQNVTPLSGVVGVISPLTPGVTDQVSADGHAAVALVGVRGSASQLQKLAPQLTQAAARAATPAVRVVVTGESEIWADMTTQETADLAQAERIGIPIALLVLLLAFGSLVAAGLPLVLAVVGIVVTFGGLAVAARFTSFDLFIETIVTMIGLGVGTDYAMFITTRYREELARIGATKAGVAEAVGVALGSAGKAIFFSGLTVVLALSSLLLVNSRLFRDMAVGAMATVTVTMAVALTLLPAILGLLGARINWLAVPFLRRGLQRPDPDRGGWARWSRAVMRHPIVWAVLAVTLLLVISAPLTQLNLGLDLGTSDLANYPSGQGVAILKREFSPGAISPIQIVVTDPQGSLSDADLAFVARLTATLRQDARVAEVVSLTSALDQSLGAHDTRALAAAETQPAARQLLGYLVNAGEGNDTTIINAVSRAPTDANAALDLVRDLRTRIIPQARGASVGRLTVLVGGLSAQIVDLSHESTQKFPSVIALVLLLAFLLLTLAFRSLLLPLKAIVLNLLSVGAAYGLLVVVFQQGAGARLFGFTPVGNLQVYLPLLTYAFLFGLSMDYEVFMVGRMREEWERTQDNTTAVARGLQHSGRAITSAATIMVVVFLAFTTTRMLEIKEIGFALAAAVFIDATVIRVLLVPAAMRLMGRWNWWAPRWLDRLLPNIALGEDSSPSALSVTPGVGEAQPASRADERHITSGV